MKKDVMPISTLKLLGLTILVSLICMCSNPADMGKTGIGPGYPEMSPIPLVRNSEWIFIDTEYDSLGNIRYTDSLILEIGRKYGLTDSSLVEITQANENIKFPEYLYEHEWNKKGEGLLILYRDEKESDIPGLYIAGEFTGEEKPLYDSVLLWLASPVKNVYIWEIPMPDDTVTQEVVSTDTLFYYLKAENNSILPIQFCNCLLYRTTKNNNVRYYYYSYHIGLVGFMEYEAGILRRTLILESFNLGIY